MEKRINWLDQIRGISALLVLILHLFQISLVNIIYRYAPDLKGTNIEFQEIIEKFFSLTNDNFIYDLNKLISGYWDIGKIGVIMFFAVSGFVIPYSIMKYKDFPVKKFIISRFFRLYPVYWLSLIVLLVMGIFWRHKSYNFIDVFANFTMFQKFFLIDDINGVAWTLQIELAFYLLIALLFMFKLINNNKIIYALICFFNVTSVSFAIIRHQTGIELPIAFSTGLTVMLFGMLWRKYLFKESDISLKILISHFVIFLLVLIPTCYFGYGESRYMGIPYFLRYISTYYAAALIFVLCSLFLKVKSVLFEFLGKISYSTYLFHAIIGGIVIEYVYARLPMAYMSSHTLLIFITLLADAVIIYLFSTITFYLIENNSINLGKHIIKKIEKVNEPVLSQSS